MLTYHGKPIPTWKLWATLALVAMLVTALFCID